ncbi:MAG: hypothetical protein ABF778_09375 [Liquorilactobacillus hordei]
MTAISKKIGDFLKNTNELDTLKLDDLETQNLFSEMFSKKDKKYTKIEAYFRGKFVQDNTGLVAYTYNPNPRKGFQGNFGQRKVLEYSLKKYDINVPFPLPVENITATSLGNEFIDHLKEEIFNVDFNYILSLFSEDNILRYKDNGKIPLFNYQEPLIINNEGFKKIIVVDNVEVKDYWRIFGKPLEDIKFRVSEGIMGPYLIDIDFENAFRIVRKSNLVIIKNATSANVIYLLDFVSCNENSIKFVKFD